MLISFIKDYILKKLFEHLEPKVKLPWLKSLNNLILKTSKIKKT